MNGLVCSFSELLYVDLVKIQVTGCWYKQAHVLVAMFTTVILYYMLDNKVAINKGLFIRTKRLRDMFSVKGTFKQGKPLISRPSTCIYSRPSIIISPF